MVNELTYWGRATHICVGKLTFIGSDNGLSPGRRQGIIWTSAGILLIGPLGTNFSEIAIGIQTFSFKKIHLKMSSGKGWPFCLGLNVLINTRAYQQISLVFSYYIFSLVCRVYPDIWPYCLSCLSRHMISCTLKFLINVALIWIYEFMYNKVSNKCHFNPNIWFYVH